MAKFPKIRLPTLSFNLIPSIVEQSKLTPSFPVERRSPMERQRAYRAMKRITDPEHKREYEREYYSRPENKKYKQEYQQAYHTRPNFLRHLAYRAFLIPSFDPLPNIIEQSKLTPSFPVENQSRSERIAAYRRMRLATDPEYVAKTLAYKRKYYSRPENQAKRKEHSRKYEAGRREDSSLFSPIPGIVEQSKLTPSFPVEQLSNFERQRAYSFRPEVKARRGLKETITEYQYLLGLNNPTVRQIRRLEALADYLGRDIEEARNERMREEHAELLRGKQQIRKNRFGRLSGAMAKAERKKLRTDKIATSGLSEEERAKLDYAKLRPMDFNYRPVTSQLTFRSGKTLEPILLRNQGNAAEAIELEHTGQTKSILGTRDYDIDVDTAKKKSYVPLGFMIHSATSPNKISYMEVALKYPNRALKQEVVYDLLKKRGTIEVQPYGLERPWWEKIGAERTEQPSAILLAMPHTSATDTSEASERIPLKLTRSAFEAVHISPEVTGPFGSLNPERLPTRDKVPVSLVPKEYGWRHVDVKRVSYGAPHLIHSKEGMGSYQGTRLGKMNPGGSMMTSKPRDATRRYEEMIRTYINPEEDAVTLNTEKRIPGMQPLSPGGLLGGPVYWGGDSLKAHMNEIEDREERRLYKRVAPRPEGRLEEGQSNLAAIERKQEIRRMLEENPDYALGEETETGIIPTEDEWDETYSELKEDKGQALTQEEMRPYLAYGHAKTPELAEAEEKEIEEFATQIAKKEDKK